MSEEMNQTPALQRYLPDVSLPASSYVPGISPPTAKEDYTIPNALGQPVFVPQAKWQNQSYYLYGIDLFNDDKYWEAHEVWGAVLKATKGFDDDQTLFFQALIQFSAARLHSHCDRWRQAKFQAGRAIQKFQTLSHSHQIFMGLDLTGAISKLNKLLTDAPGKPTENQLQLLS